jgi:hypothetical protein
MSMPRPLPRATDFLRDARLSLLQARTSLDGAIQLEQLEPALSRELSAFASLIANLAMRIQDKIETSPTGRFEVYKGENP